MARRKRRSVKKPSQRVICEEIWSDEQWRVLDGELKRNPGHPGGTKSLFKVVAEKIPFDALDAVRKNMREYGLPMEGVYLAHDSMGCVRYAGRGHIFNRLNTRRKRQPLELAYFSFYVVEDKKHEREIETLVIRAASPLLHFNERKKRVDITAGSIGDYEPGTMFYIRRYTWGTRPKRKKKTTRRRR